MKLSTQTIGVLKNFGTINEGIYFKKGKILKTISKNKNILAEATIVEDIPKIPKDLVRPTIVAGINALGRGQDRESLGQFFTIIAQTLGPEAIGSFLNIDEAIKRLAAAQGIDVLNLVKSMQEVKQEQQQNFQQQQQLELTKQAAALASTPAMDPSKNPEALNQLYGQADPSQAPEVQEGTPPPGI